MLAKPFNLAAALLAFLLAEPLAAREWADASGKFRVEADLVVVRGDKVVLELSDGRITSVPIERLSAADRAYLAAQTPAAVTPATTSPTPSSTPAPLTGQVDASAVAATLERHCHRCHGEDGASEGGFNYVLALDKLRGTYVEAGDPEASLLLERMAADDDSVMPPPGEERPSATELDAVRAWIAAGATPAVPGDSTRRFITADEVHRAILADLKAAPERSRRFFRYFTLTHLYNAGTSEDELQTYRNALTKLVNSLSWNSQLFKPESIDPQKTILRVDIRQANWTDDTWAAIEASNPYYLSVNTPVAGETYNLAQTEMPFVRADWFVFAASRPPLYHDVLEIPETETELEGMLRVNSAANIDQERVLRAGFNRSGVSQNNRLIERHDSPYGGYWKSYDFGGNVGRQNLFEHPMGPASVVEPFKHDGGELIFTLPNGLQGYMLADGAGRRIDKGPTEIVSDPERPDRSVTNGVSCMSCHYAGIIPKQDEIRPFVEANQRAFDDPHEVLALYRPNEQLNQSYQSDMRSFAEAMAKIGIKSLSRSGEPVSAMAARFEQELDLRTAASEFGMPPEDFVGRLKSASEMSRSFGALLTPGGTVKRDVFVSLFGRAAAEFITSDGSRGGRGFSPRAAKLSLGGEPGEEVLRFKDMRWGVSSLAFSQRGLLAAGKPDRALLVFDALKGSQVFSAEKLEHLDQLGCAVFTPDGGTLLTGGRKGQIQVWQVGKDGQLSPAGKFVGHSKELLTIAVAPDGRHTVSGGSDASLRYWRIEDGRELAAFTGFEQRVKACCILPNGRTALATDLATVFEYDLKSLKEKRRLKINDSWASGQAAGFSPDGRLVAVGHTYDILILDTETGQERAKLQASDIQWSLAFTPDGERLVSGATGRVNVWEVKSGRKIASIELGGSYVQTLAVSADGRYVAAIPGSAGQDLRVFRLPD